MMPPPYDRKVGFNMDERRQKQMDALKAKRGYLLPFHVFLIEHDPDFLDKYDALVERALGLGQPVSGAGLHPKYRELIVAALLAFRGSEEGLKAHVKRALRLGATPKEVLDAFEAAMIPGGAPTLLAGCEALEAVLSDSGAVPFGPTPINEGEMHE